MLSVVGAMVIIGSSSGLAQDVTITNVAQFTDLLDQTGLVYPLVNPWQPAMFYPTLGIFYCDFDQLTNAIGDVRHGTASIQDGVSVWGVRLIRTASGTTVVYPSGNATLLNLPAGENDDFEVRYAEVLRGWCVLFGKNPTSYDDLISQGYSFLAPKSIVLDVWLADINDCSVAQSLSMSVATMDDSCDSCDDPPPDSSDFEYDVAPDAPCGRLAFNKFKISTNNFILEWFSQSNATYEIASTRNMTSTNWVSLASLYPGASNTNVTDFFDFGAVTNGSKFYKVVQTGISIDMCNSNAVEGVLNVQFDIGMPTNQPLTAVYMLLDGLSSTAIVNPSTQFVGSVYGQLDTTVVSNGWHTLQAFADSGIYNESIGGTTEYSSQIVNLLVTNPITLYVPFAYGGTAPPFTFPIQAIFVAPTNNWTIQVLTTNTPATVLKTFSGTSTNGIAYVEWDGTDSSNHPYAGLGVGVTASISNVTGLTELAMAPLGSGSGSGSSVGPKYSYVGGLTRGNQQAWALAYQGGVFPDCNSSGGAPFCSMFEDDNGLAGPPDYGGLANILTLEAPTSYNVVNINNVPTTSWDSCGCVGEIDSFVNWISFWHGFSAGAGPACFFLISHGSPQGLGSGNNSVTIGDVQTILGNYKDAKGFHLGTPFYFGQFDGCNTLGWEQALGIPSMQLTANYFRQLNLNPMACLTWSSTKIWGITETQFNSAHEQMIDSFYYNWLVNGDGVLQHSVTTIWSGGLYGTAPVVNGATDLPRP
jgi:hypothetical protein